APCAPWLRPGRPGGPRWTSPPRFLRAAPGSSRGDSSMFPEHNSEPIGQAPPTSLDLQERGLRPPPGYGCWRRLGWWFDFLVLVKLARLRFLAVLAAVGGVIAYWDTLTAYYEKWARPPAEQASAAPDTEFWCPMHPTVVRDKPDKCPL